jgi:hypothetical protein
MKLFILVVLVTALPAQAQQLPGPLEGANVIAVLLADSGTAAQQHVLQVLAARGYRAQAYDATRGRIETQTHPTPHDCLFSLEALVLGHTILLSGNTHCILRDYVPKAVSYSTANRVPVGNFDCYKWGWNELAAVAEELKGKKIVTFRHP